MKSEENFLIALNLSYSNRAFFICSLSKLFICFFLEETLENMKKKLSLGKKIRLLGGILYHKIKADLEYIFF